MLLEAQATARLSHPNVVAVHDVGLYGDGIYMAMELIDGPTLDNWLAEDVDRAWTDVVEVLRAAAEGLAAAHAAGLVHRDFKPQNVMIGRDGRVRVLDFGLVHRVHDVPDSFEITADGSEPGTSDTASLVLDAPRTRADSLVGTPAYMAPEQFEAGPVDARTDQFAFCVVAFVALFGMRPYAGDTIPELRAAVRKGRLQTPPQGTGVPARVRRALVRGLSPDPARRFPDMAHLLRELRDVRPRWQTWGLTAAGLAAVVGLGVGVSIARTPAAAPGHPCAASGGALDEVWNDDRRRQIEAQFSSLQLGFADVTLAEVERRIDEYAGGWVAQHQDACEATHVRHEQSSDLLDRRTACLQRRKAALAALLSVLEDADESVAENAIAASASLPMLAPCEDLERLLAAPEIEHTPDPELQQLLARSRAERQAARHGRALVLAEEAVARLGTSGAPAGRVEAWIELGHAQNSLGKHKEARSSFRKAFFEAHREGLDLLAARSAIGLIELEGVGDREDPGASDWVELAEVAATRAGRSAELEMELESALASALGFVGRCDEGLLHAQRFLDLSLRRHGEDHPVTADAYQSLSSLQSRLGRHEEAIANARRALDVTRDAFGSPHPEVVHAERRVGDACGPPPRSTNRGACPGSAISKATMRPVSATFAPPPAPCTTCYWPMAAPRR